MGFSLHTDAMFQSTRPRGARLSLSLPCVWCVIVSIHAPAWGATPIRGRATTDDPCFNPRARVGRDVITVCLRSCGWRFNPRARVGRDITRSAGQWPARAFQSTRPRGARLGMASRPPVGRRVSIHAPAWGATRGGTAPETAAPCFNPRARVGRDMGRCLCSSSRRCFNPRARVGRDGRQEVLPRVRARFNPRARVGRDLLIITH